MSWITDLKTTSPTQLLALATVCLPPVLLGGFYLLLCFPTYFSEWNIEKIIFAGAIPAILIELAFIGIALGAMYDELEIHIRIRQAAISGAAFFLISGVIGLFFAYISSSGNVLIPLFFGWLLLGWAVRLDTIALQREIEERQANQEPSEQSSHFYWARREEIFNALKPVNWN